MKLSIVSPVYKAEKIVPELVRRIRESVLQITDEFEIILVEDGGPDNSWDAIENECNKNSDVIGIKLSRNFGQHYAISAGLENASGDYIIVIDCDLQDDPIYFKDLVNKAKEGYEIVYTKKTKREHNLLKNITATFFNRIYNSLLDDGIQGASDKVGSFSLISKKVKDAYLAMGDYRRHYLMILRWLGFNSDVVEVEHNERFEGRSSYSWGKLIIHALDGITSQSDKILRVTALFGFVLSFLAMIMALTIGVLYLYRPFAPGWPSLVVLILLIGGLTITSIGVCGIYVGKTFEQSKNRPLYIIDKKLNKDK